MTTSTPPPLDRTKWVEIAKKGPKYYIRDKKDKEKEKKHKRGLALLGASLGSSFGGLGLGILGTSLWKNVQATRADSFIPNVENLDRLPKQQRRAMEKILTSIDTWANDLTDYAYKHPREVNLDYLNVFALLGITPDYNLNSEFQENYRKGVPPQGWNLPPGVRLHVIDIGGTDGVPPKPREPLDVIPLVPQGRGEGRGAARHPGLPTIPEEPEPVANRPAPAGTPGPNAPPAATPMPITNAPRHGVAENPVLSPAIPDQGPWKLCNNPTGKNWEVNVTHTLLDHCDVGI